ncbi:MAG: hypothetical protein Mars2KO_16570 [Maribacter sp.]
MDVGFTNPIPKKIKYGLVFFCGLLCIGCGREGVVTIKQVDYEHAKAVGVTFDTTMDVEQLRVFVGAESQTSVIGVIVSEGHRHRFTPVVPFTSGQTYTLRQQDTVVLASFSIPEVQGIPPAEVLAIYPQVDTVPENLLKVYLKFNRPMQRLENALDHITVTDATDGTVVQPFLRLESELWNAEGTLLTLWLDPGRIKTDLIPNRELGLPLESGKRYRLEIDSGWKSQDGMALQQRYSKTWVVGQRDDQRPALRNWTLEWKEATGKAPLTIDFGEPMDAFLGVETLQFFDDVGRINGKLEFVGQQQQQLRFTPEREWQGPEIKIQVENRLEDLSGNNLARLFDRPIAEGAEAEPDTSKSQTLRIRRKE